jgi:hypothetical protein
LTEAQEDEEISKPFAAPNLKNLMVDTVLNTLAGEYTFRKGINPIIKQNKNGKHFMKKN